MAIDLTGGLDPFLEYFQPARPDDPEMRDSATLWIMEEKGRIAFPRVTFDAIGGDWETPWVQLNGVTDDGRTLRLWSREPGSLELNEAGQPQTRGAGPLQFRCVEPFRRWEMTFDGIVRQSTSAAEVVGSRAFAEVPLSLSVTAEMVAPPWLMGGVTPEAAQAMRSGGAGALMGGVRYEQLCRVKGMATLDGREYPVTGTGMRVRRQGVRNMGAAIGHCQHSALFPSGKAFGAIIMAPGPEGPEAFNEAFVLLPGGRKVAARITRAPWMTRLQTNGDDATLTLETELGEIRIEGEVIASLFDHHDFEMAETSILHQGTARYLWDGEETIGLIERCTLRDRLRDGASG